ncbi:MAG TPA: hypothetical protein VNY52_06985 [Solirubrobacteraceae bacterium]|nr:hypothetical protein [Solirubrobacteraceae bacterium]
MPSEARIHGGADPEGRSAGSALVHAWGALDRDRRLAAVAAVALFATMFLPWYQQNAVVSAAKAAPLVSRNLNAFAVFSFIEAAVLLVALAVLFLLFERAQGRDFRLPGGDGTMVLAAGLWTALLLVLRLFDKPGVTQHGVAANVGVQWGIFFALAAAGLLAYAGSRMRVAQRPEPPLMRRTPPPRRPAERPAAEEDATAVLARRAQRQSAAPVPASERPAGAAPAREPFPPAPPSAATAAGRAPRRPPAPEAEQLSFEDPPEQRGA